MGATQNVPNLRHSHCQGQHDDKRKRHVLGLRRPAGVADARLPSLKCNRLTRPEEPAADAGRVVPRAGSRPPHREEATQLHGQQPSAGRARDVWAVRTVLLADLRVASQQAETNEQVGLATAHRLLEMENRLRGSAGQPGGALADEIEHAMGYECLGKERLTIALGDYQLVKLLDLIAQFDVERVRL